MNSRSRFGVEDNIQSGCLLRLISTIFLLRIAVEKFGKL